MYKKYKALLATSLGHGYPGHGSKDTADAGRKTKFDSYDSSKTYTEYSYGKERKKPKYWERDLKLQKRFLSRWKKKTKEDSPRDGSSSPKRTPSPTLPEPPPVQPRPKPKPKPEELAKQLHVKDVDFHIERNTVKHRTDKFACTSDREYEKNEGEIVDLPAELVVRRGDSFEITITFDRPYVNEKNDLQLIFSLGDKPKPSVGTLICLSVDESGNEKFRHDKWGATLKGKDGNKISILVNIPSNCIVGEWNFTVKTFSEGKGENDKTEVKIWQYESDEDVTILFNAWCKHDAVYMENEKELDEYVLNDNGCVYRGNWAQCSAKEWNFGQFEEEILEIALTLLRLGFKGGASKQMSDPVMASRIIAKMINCCDDNGVLVGNWSGNYEDGVSPSKWGGSIKILKQWLRDGPVQYGQCWVFSCVTTTVCRALGIPCRSVTNFASAHDTDGSCVIEKYYINKAKNEVDKYLSSDSVWNFHVWNEAWMCRPDLKDLQPEFECLREPGWQVIDATPQELSEGVFTCGPSPVLAVRMGYCKVKYDTDFIFAEVNADRIDWEMQPDGEYKRSEEIQKRSVGKKISTKIADGLPYKHDDRDETETNWYSRRDPLSEKKRLDVTMCYKPREGTEEERESVKMAQKTAKNSKKENYEEVKEYNKIKPVEFHLNHDNNVMIGGEMKITLTAKNDSDHDRNICCPEIIVYSKSYTGETGEYIESKCFNDELLKKGDETTFEFVLEPGKYLPKLIDQASISIVTYGTVEPVSDERPQVLHKEHDVRFRRPDLEVTGPKAIKVGQEANFSVSFKNPLDVALTECDISMESAGLKDIKDEKQPDVKPGEEYTKTFCIKANKKPKDNASLTFSFDCKQLKDISGGCTINILK